MGCNFFSGCRKYIQQTLYGLGTFNMRLVGHHMEMIDLNQDYSGEYREHKEGLRLILNIKLI